MTVGELDKSMVTLVPDQIILKQKRSMTMFNIIEEKIEHIDKNNTRDGMQVVITLKRKFVNDLLTTYLPTILLILITYCTTFFKENYFEAALGANLTIMLVMTTIFTDVSQSLPMTAYIKLIDLWLIFGQFIPFTEVILLTIMDGIKETEDERGTKAINQNQEKVVELGNRVSVVKVGLQYRIQSHTLILNYLQVAPIESVAPIVEETLVGLTVTKIEEVR